MATSGIPMPSNTMVDGSGTCELVNDRLSYTKAAGPLSVRTIRLIPRAEILNWPNACVVRVVVPRRTLLALNACMVKVAGADPPAAKIDTLAITLSKRIVSGSVGIPPSDIVAPRLKAKKLGLLRALTPKLPDWFKIAPPLLPPGPLKCTPNEAYNS